MRQIIDITRLTTPPQHAVDDVALWVAPHAPEWDYERVNAEREILITSLMDERRDQLSAGYQLKSEDGEINEDRDQPSEAQLRELVAQVARELHPVNAWMACKSGYSWDAPLTIPELLRTEDRPASTATIGDYLTATPVRFELRSLTAREWRSINGLDSAGRTLERVRRGLVAMLLPDGQRIDPPRGGDGLISEQWVDLLDRSSDRMLLDLLSGAVYQLSTQRGGDAEGKP